MREFTIEIRTIEGIADNEALDRLAELLYDRAELVDPLLGLNDDGSISASFAYAASDLKAALEALDVAVAAIAEAIPVGVGPAAVERIAVAPAGEREPALR